MWSRVTTWCDAAAPWPSSIPVRTPTPPTGLQVVPEGPVFANCNRSREIGVQNVMNTAASTTIAPTVSSVKVTVHHQIPIGQLVVSTSEAGVTSVRFAKDDRTIDDTSRDSGTAR